MREMGSPGGGWVSSFLIVQIWTARARLEGPGSRAVVSRALSENRGLEMIAVGVLDIFARAIPAPAGSLKALLAEAVNAHFGGRGQRGRTPLRILFPAARAQYDQCDSQ